VRDAADAEPELPALRLAVLGPLRLSVGAADVEVPGSKRRAVLAMLAMGAPEPVAADRLVDAIWPDQVPVSGRAALQSHVSRLRRHLGAHAGRLTGGEGSYRLLLHDGELDAWALEQAARTGRVLVEQDPRAARELLVPVHGSWRGPPLTDVGDVLELAAWARALTETWLDLCDLVARASLACGDAATAAKVVYDALAAEPLRESSCVLLVRALGVQGRSAEALRVAHDFRARLREETGLDPTGALAEVEHEVAAGEARAAAAPVLPTPVAPLLGRRAEVAGVLRLLDAERLVTIVGPGGVGKTHLAIEVARHAASTGDLTLLALAPVTDPAAVADVLARALGLDAGPGDLVGRCAARLRTGEHLLVIDNCEHLLDAVRTLVATLLTACPELAVLATSRERLALSVEQTCPLAPLPMPPQDPAGDLAAVPSVALFVDRARRVRPGFAPDGDELAAVARIVRALDGMPLAIELAAGRVGAMTVHDIETRLDRALDLVGAAAGADARHEGRHRSLRGAIQWSYDLLDSEERRLFRNLAVFPGGFDLATAELVAADLGVQADPATLLAHLVDASMLVADLGAVPRYRMLDTLRTFGIDRLAAEGEHEAAVDRLLRWAVEVAGWFDRVVDTEDEPDVDARLRAELANLRTAWRTARDGGDLDVAATLVLSLYTAISWRDLSEAWRWALELADDPSFVGHPEEAAVVGVASEAAWFSAGDLARAEQLARRAMARATRADPRGWAMSHWALGDVLLFRATTKRRGRWRSSRGSARAGRPRATRRPRCARRTVATSPAPASCSMRSPRAGRRPRCAPTRHTWRERSPAWRQSGPGPSARTARRSTSPAARVRRSWKASHRWASSRHSSRGGACARRCSGSASSSTAGSAPAAGPSSGRRCATSPASSSAWATPRPRRRCGWRPMPPPRRRRCPTNRGRRSRAAPASRAHPRSTATPRSCSRAPRSGARSPSYRRRAPDGERPSPPLAASTRHADGAALPALVRVVALRTVVVAERREAVELCPRGRG
jgi:predicted ATPase/DNA-binding SARP family transcriptional activator